jgi:hypothetical protein
MTKPRLRLVASSDDRALAIRDHLLPLIRGQGRLQVQRDVVRVIALELDDWLISHWTPFNEVSVEEAASPAYRHAIEQQRSRPDLPYGLEVWCGDRVLSVLWDEHGAFAVPCFIRGDWEDEALAL